MVEAPPDTKAYWLLEDENAVIEAIQSDFHRVAASITGAAPKPLRAAHIGEPASYGDKFPAWVFYRVTSTGTSRIAEAQEKMLAAEYICQILVLERATLPSTAQENSGRGYAEAVTRKGFSAWVAALAQAYEIHGRSAGIARSSTSSGSHSEFGRAMFMDESRNILWAQSAEIRVVL